MTLRVQVDTPSRDRPGLERTTVVYVPSVDELAPDVVELVQPHVNRILDTLGEQTDDVWFLLAELAEQIADGAAYDREAARRGVLAL